MMSEEELGDPWYLRALTLSCAKFTQETSAQLLWASPKEALSKLVEIPRRVGAHVDETHVVPSAINSPSSLKSFNPLTVPLLPLPLVLFPAPHL